MEYICSQSDANGLHTCGNLPPYTVNGIKCNLTIDEYEYVSNDSCINWNVYYNECQVGHFSIKKMVVILQGHFSVPDSFIKVLFRLCKGIHFKAQFPSTISVLHG